MTGVQTCALPILLMLAHIRCGKTEPASLMARSILDTDITHIHNYDKRMRYEGIKHVTARIAENLSAYGTDFDMASSDPFS